MKNDLTSKKHTESRRFTLEEATTMLPLVRSIVSDICGVFRDVTSRRLELHRLLRKGNRGGNRSAGRAYDDEMAESRADLQAKYDQIWGYKDELDALGVILRQPEEGLVEFPTQLGGQDAFFSWQLEEPTITHFRWASEPPNTRWQIGVQQN